MPDGLLVRAPQLCYRGCSQRAELVCTKPDGHDGNHRARIVRGGVDEYHIWDDDGHYNVETHQRMNL